MAVERNKFERSAMRAAEKSTAGIGLAAVNQTSDIFKLNLSQVQRIDNFFIMFTKDCL